MSPAGGVIGHYPLYHHHKIAPFHTAIFLKPGGSAESAALQHLGVEHQSSRFPMKKLHTVAVTVDEDIDISVKGIAPHPVANHSRERVETLAHIRWLGIEPVAHTVVEAEHGSKAFYQCAQ